VIAGDDVGVLLRGTVHERDARWQLAHIGFAGGALWLRDDGVPVGRAVRVRVLARDVSIATDKPRNTSVQNLLPCAVGHVAPDARQPSQVLVRLDCLDDDAAPSGPGSAAGAALLARITARAAHDLGLAPGMRVWAQVKAAALVE
ncbi:MAG TPA: TOBE domain-containing protein, partial [Ramlibacter sp.]|nr:TOBE domain-containing protein [Ramlibacter sp.]